MVKLFDTSGNGYIEVNVSDFYCNDFSQYFARTGKKTYLRDFNEPFYTIPDMHRGSAPIDGGNLLLTPDERDELVAKNPAAQKWIRKFVGAREFIQNIPRYCLWLVDCPPNELRKMPLVYQRVQNVREFRLNSKREATQKAADTPWLFAERHQPTDDYILVPRHSSKNRFYVPMDYVSSEIISGDANLMVPGAKLWHFGVLTSLPHMAWMRMVCGRIRDDYRYSAEVVYNNFPWPPFNREVERTASEILMVRRKYPDASFADLYDPLIMPKDLRKAHERNDRAVMNAYDFPKNMTEAQMQIAFMNMYESTVNLLKLMSGKEI